MLLNCGIEENYLRVCWTVRRSSHSILKEIDPEYSLEELMLKLKFQYFGHLMWRADSFKKTLMLEKTECRKRRAQQSTRCFDFITDSVDMSLSNLSEWWRTEKPCVMQSMGLQGVGHDWVTDEQWTIYITLVILAKYWFWNNHNDLIQGKCGNIILFDQLKCELNVSCHF